MHFAFGMVCRAVAVGLRLDQLAGASLFPAMPFSADPSEPLQPSNKLAARPEFSELVWRRWKRWRKWVALLGAALLVGLAIYFIPLLFQSGRRLLMREAMEQVEAAVERGDWMEVRNLTRSILQEHPDDLDALRLLHLALGVTNDPKVHYTSLRLLEHSGATAHDRVEALRTLVDHAPQAMAMSRFKSLPAPEQATAAATAVLGELLLRRGEPELLEARVRALPERELHQPLARLTLVRALAAQPLDAARLAELRGLLAGLLAEAPGDALDALEVLAGVPGALAPGAPLPPLAEWIASQPAARPVHHLVGLDQQLGATPERAEAIYQEGVARFAGSAPAELCAWLVRHGRAGLAADALREVPTPEAFRARVEALLQAGRGEDAARLLDAPVVELEMFDLGLLRVKAAIASGDPGKVTAAWNQLVKLAQLDSQQPRLIELARCAEQLGAASVAERAWVAAIRAGSGPLPTYADFRPLFASLAAQDRGREMTSLLSVLLEFEPDNPVLRAEYLYLALVQGELVPASALEQFEGLLSGHPEQERLASYTAMAALMARQPRRALAILRETSQPQDSRFHAMLGVALVQSGELAEAQPHIAAVAPNSLLREEVAILRKLYTRFP